MSNPPVVTAADIEAHLLKTVESVDVNVVTPKGQAMLRGVARDLSEVAAQQIQANLREKRRLESIRRLEAIIAQRERERREPFPVWKISEGLGTYGRLLCGGGFVGWHHYYRGDSALAWSYLLTGGMFGTGVVLDIFTLPFQSHTNRFGRAIRTLQSFLVADVAAFTIGRVAEAVAGGGGGGIFTTAVITPHEIGYMVGCATLVLTRELIDVKTALMFGFLFSGYLRVVNGVVRVTTQEREIAESATFNVADVLLSGIFVIGCAMAVLLLLMWTPIFQSRRHPNKYLRDIDRNTAYQNIASVTFHFIRFCSVLFGHQRAMDCVVAYHQRNLAIVKGWGGGETF